MLTRSAPMKRSPMKRTRPVPSLPADLKVVLVERSGGYCEIRLSGCTVRATDVSHRISRKAGGRPLGDLDRLSNVLHACRPCHTWCHSRPTEAKDLGLMLNEGRDPTAEPVAYRGGAWTYLADDGEVREVLL